MGMNSSQTDVAAANAALDALLHVVAQSAEDLRRFHDVIAHARRSPLPPFPRASVMLSERVIDHLAKVDNELEEVLLALGLQPPPRASK
jgi:hypothetical protein